jgi:hypothetical protein
LIERFLCYLGANNLPRRRKALDVALVNPMLNPVIGLPALKLEETESAGSSRRDPVVVKALKKRDYGMCVYSQLNSHL